MKRNLTKLMAALALLVTLAIPMGVWATDVTFSYSDYTGQGTSSTGSEVTMVKTDVNITNTKFYGNTSYAQFYANGVSTIVPKNGATITKIVLTATGTSYNGYQNGGSITASTGSVSANGATVTWTGSASSDFTLSNNKQIRWTSIVVTYSTNSNVVDTPTITPNGGNFYESQEVTISCGTTGATIQYSTNNGSTWTTYSESFTLTATTTIQAKATKSGMTDSEIAEATFTKVTPMSVAEARDYIDGLGGATSPEVFVIGIISQVESYNSNYHSITYDLSDDGTTTSDQLQVYSGLGLNGAQFNSLNDLVVGSTVVVKGTVKLYNNIYEFNYNSIIVSLTLPTITVATPTFSPVAGGYASAQNVAISCDTPNTTIYYTTDGSDPDDESTQYTDPIAVNASMTIKAVAYDASDNASAVATAGYYILSNNNVYTVGEALSFSSYPQENVFVHGIVSTAPSQTPTSNGELTYYISADGTTTDQLEVYKGKNLGNTAFTAQTDLQQGDIVTVFGKLQEYQGTIEFGSGNYLVTFERPVAPVVPTVTVADATVSVSAEGGEGTLTVTYENFTEIIADVYFCNAEGEAATYEWITAEINEDNNVEYLVEPNEGEARTAYFKVYALDDNAEEVYSNLVTINQAAYVAPVLDYATLPFEFDGGRADIETTDGLTQEGLDSDYGSSPKLKFNTTGDWLLLHFNEVPGVLTFDIKGNTFSGGTFTVQTSVDGETYTDLASYTELGNTQHETFNNLASDVRYIKWIYTEKVSGNVALGNIALAKYVAPQEYTLTVEPFENLELITFVNDAMVMEGDGEIQVTNGNQIMLSIVAMEGYVMETLMVNGVNHVNDIAEDNTYTFVMPAEDVTISATAVEYVAPVSVTYSYTLASSIESGKQYIIVGWADGTPYAMGYDRGSNRHAVEISVTGNDNENAIVTIANTETNPHEFTITSLETAGFYSIQDATASGYLYAASSNSNYLKTEAELDANGEWEITFDTESGSATVVASNSTYTRNIMRFNNQSTLFSCYSTGQHPVFLYEKVEYPLDIIGYEAGSDGGYYLIASPVTVNPANVEGMTDGEYDLYSFDQAEAEEWRNYKVNAFNLEPGKGYLYAKQATEPDEVFHFELAGTPYNGEPITLKKTENANWSGWNLVGNPYAVTAYIDRDFYVMKADGSEIIESVTDEIAPMQGIFVIAAEDDEELTFSTTAPGTTSGKIVVNVSDTRSSVIDRAMVRFGEGRTLPKFMLNGENTKIYITEGNEDFAVVRSINENSTPVSFHAAENGTYTLSVTAENLDFTYFHLIDNMTGADVDLLSTPSYSFEASTTDYAQRFRLVYATLDNVDENNTNNFAFFNGTEWVVNNQGEAILQVVDVTGRLVSSENVNGTTTLTLNQPAGIYMLRLVNGNDVKVQKVVVR